MYTPTLSEGVQVPLEHRGQVRINTCSATYMYIII